MASLSTNLTGSQIKYLFTIRRLSEEGKRVRSMDIAQLLGLAKSSVHTMLRGLEARGLVEKEPYGDVTLTAEGQRTAARYTGYYRQLYGRVAGLVKNQEDTVNAVCAFLSELSPESLEALTA